MTERIAAVASGTWLWAEEVPWGADSPGPAANGAVRRCLLTPDDDSRSQPSKRWQDCWPTPRFPIDGRANSAGAVHMKIAARSMQLGHCCPIERRHWRLWVLACPSIPNSAIHLTSSILQKLSTPCTDGGAITGGSRNFESRSSARRSLTSPLAWHDYSAILEQL
ncbi:hypothetical protein COCCADRAFT_95956 [Bipolaris zeicola 26-R-13]|uniref:Uncharacterized protein n=1 Tax=Cochliobolus carbonum (strain 26-R-13) TaxID=930089 RepID=W6YD92_COCC2|nr:uncharacterized protein COCCADRAFT_95956 [Bipolaris zeicola 26-R-13]EUC33484.1 hypothetical protein COCCADRAFT_95956 [Bipolaris zeicola 26-R-13]